MSRQVLFLILFPLALILLNTQAIMLDQVVYKNEFKKLGTYENFDLSEEELDQEVSHLIQYLKGNAPLETAFFNAKEKAHLADVKMLMQVGRWITFVVILVTVMLYRKLKNPGDTVFKGSILTIIGIVGLAVLLSTNFSSVFFSFHQAAFTNDFWLLDPATDNLIKIFEEQFFVNVSLVILKNTLITAGIIGVFVYGAKRKDKLQRKD